MVEAVPSIRVTDTRTDLSHSVSLSPITSPVHETHSAAAAAAAATATAAARSRPSSRLGETVQAKSGHSLSRPGTPARLIRDELFANAPPRSSTPQPDGQTSIDPLSQEILQRTTGQSSVASRGHRPSDSYSRPNTAADDEHAEATPKDKRKGVSFLARFIGTNKKKDAADDAKSELEAEEKDTRPEGAEAEIFHEPIDNMGFNPEHLSPPAYIKIRSRNKNAREFNRLFCAQALALDGPAKQEQTNGSRVRDISSAEDEAVWALEFSRDGRYLASTGRDGSVQIWSVLANRQDRRAHEKEEEEAKEAKGPASMRLSAPVFRSKPLRSFTGHTGPILSLSWSKNNFLLSCSMDKTVRLWHVTQNECLCVFKHNDVVTSIQFHPKDDRFFLAGSLDSRLRLWSIPDKTVEFHVAVSDIITAVSFTPDGRTAIAGCVSGLCSFFDTEHLKLQTQIHVKSAHGKNAKGSKITGLETMCLPPGSNNVKLLVTSNDSRIRLYNIRDRSLEMKFKGNENTASQIRARFSDDGRYVVCGSEDKRVFIWSTVQPENERRNRWPVEMFEAHTQIVTAAALAPVRTRMLLSASEDPLYDLCNPPPVTLVSTSEIESPPSEKASDADANSIQPTPATAEGGSSFKRPFESPAYITRTTHKNGNLVVTADAKGNIKVFRQDCAWDKRNADPWETSAHRTVRVGSSLMRRASLATQSSKRSRQNSIKSQAPSERILSWRQSITSSTSLERRPSAARSVASAMTRDKNAATQRQASPRNRTPRLPSRRSSVAPSQVLAATPPSEREVTFESDRRSTGATRKSSIDTTYSASQASFHRANAPVMQRGSSNISATSSQYWRTNAWQDEIIEQLQHAQASTRSPQLGTLGDPRRQFGDGSRVNSSSGLSELAQLELKMSRLSQLTGNGEADEAKSLKAGKGGTGLDAGIRCRRCQGQDFRARARVLGGAPKLACTKCGLSVAAS